MAGKLDVRFKMSDKQLLTLDALSLPEVSEVCYGGGKGGGKSVFGCRWSVIKCKEIIDLLKLRPSSNPLPVGFMGRAQSVNFTDTTLETFKAFVPPQVYKLNESKKEIIICDTVKLDYGGMDSQEIINKFNSGEYVFIFIDQAEELTRDMAGTLRGTLYRFKRKLPEGIYKILWTANPGMCFLKDDFIKNPIAGRKFIQALYSDNPFIDQVKYKAQLEEAWKHRPEMIRALVYGDWDSIEGANRVFTEKIIDRAKSVNIARISPFKFVTACDPAWSNPDADETVIYTLKSGVKIDERFLGGKNTIEVAGEIVNQAQRNSAKLILVDAIGIGAGVYDQVCKYTDIRCMAVNSAKASDYPDKFVNMRSEMTWTAMELMAGGQVKLHDDPELERELKEINYEIKYGKIKIESKEDIKQRLGRSPDRADAFIMALWGQKHGDWTYEDRKGEQYEPVEPERKYRGF